MHIVFLGTGPDRIVEGKEKNRRTNSSLLIRHRDKNILIDCTPYLSEQLEREAIKDIDYLLLTHAHSDCIDGIPRLGELLKEKTIPAFASEQTWKKVEEKFKRLEFLKKSSLKQGEALKVEDLEVVPFRLIHAEAFPTGKDFPCVGFRVEDGKNSLVYAEDFEEIPEESEKYFKNLDVIVADGALYFSKSIRGHLSVDQTLELAKKYEPKKLYIIQAGHTYPPYEKAIEEIGKYWDKIKDKCRTEIYLSYDGLKFEMGETKRAEKLVGLYLTPPHGKLIAQRKKTAIVKAIELKKHLNEPLYLLSGNLCYGIIELDAGKEIDLEEFKKLYPRHLITEKEKSTWWPKREKLYFYNIKVVRLFKKPISYLFKQGVQNFMENVEFISQRAKKKFADLTPDDLKKLDNTDLVYKHLRAHQLFANFREWKKAVEPIVNVHLFIVEEMLRREMQHHMRDELDELSQKLAKQGKSLGYKIKKALGEIKDLVIVPHYVSLIGSCVTGEEAHDIDILIRSDFRQPDFELKLRRTFPEELRGKLHFVYLDSGPHSSYVPLFDLVARKYESPMEISVEEDYPVRRSLEEFVDDVFRAKKIELMKPFEALKPSAYASKFFDLDILIKTWITEEMLKKGVACEIKLDGLRTNIHKKGNEILIYFEDAKKDRSEYLPKVVEELKELPAKELILDGELLEFQDGQQVSRKDLIKWATAKDPGDDKGIIINIFDALWADGKPLNELPWHERQKNLRKVLP